MTAAELKVRCPKLYQQVFAAGVAAQRKRMQVAALIAGETQSPRGIQPPAAVAENARALRAALARIGALPGARL
jgi:hypothetical protein